jgi:hypothetical protein
LSCAFSGRLIHFLSLLPIAVVRDRHANKHNFLCGVIIDEQMKADVIIAWNLFACVWLVTMPKSAADQAYDQSVSLL